MSVPFEILTVVYTHSGLPAALFGKMFSTAFESDNLHRAHVQTHM